MMQSYLSIVTTAFLTLEIVFFLLCIISQFKKISFSVIGSALINLAFLILLQQAFLNNENFPTRLHCALLGLMPFMLLSILIFSLDFMILKSQKNLAFKLPFLGLAIGYYIPLPYFYLSLGIILSLIFSILWKNKQRYRLYFRAYLFKLIFLVIFFINIQWGNVVLIKFLSLFFIIFYLNQFLNLMMVKQLLKTNLGEIE
jgi:hypothetical protein